MGKPRAEPRSPDKVLRQASMTLGVLGSTLQEIRDGLESVRGSMALLGKPNLLNAIDELDYVSYELGCTRLQIGKARAEIRRRRAPKRPKPN